MQPDMSWLGVLEHHAVRTPDKPLAVLGAIARRDVQTFIARGRADPQERGHRRRLQLDQRIKDRRRRSPGGFLKMYDRVFVGKHACRRRHDRFVRYEHRAIVVQHAPRDLIIRRTNVFELCAALIEGALERGVEGRRFVGGIGWSRH